VLLVIAATAAARGLASAPSTDFSTATAPPSSTIAPVADAAHSEHPGARGEADGGGPGEAGLDPDLLDALRRAAEDAADDGVELVVTSGRRSPEHQAQLFREAIAKYGSASEAARWVATPETSPHVSGDAVDVGPPAAAAWLSAHGAEYGLCQIYGNEPWHYELRPEASAHGCPATYADPTHDPRMHR
jgi:D-alanyl-D-alanine carboxypeptidase